MRICRRRKCVEAVRGKDKKERREGRQGERAIGMMVQMVVMNPLFFFFLHTCPSISVRVHFSAILS